MVLLPSVAALANNIARTETKRNIEVCFWKDNAALLYNSCKDSIFIVLESIENLNRDKDAEMSQNSGAVVSIPPPPTFRVFFSIFIEKSLFDIFITRKKILKQDQCHPPFRF